MPLTTTSNRRQALTGKAGVNASNPVGAVAGLLGKKKK
jgi:hypothetical protein